MENSSTTNDQSFWQFSDQLRLQTSALASLSIGGSDNIWGDAFLSKNRRPEDRRNFNINTANTNDDNSPPSLLGNPDHLFGSEQQQPKQKQTAPPLLSDFNNGAGNGNNAFGWKYGSKSAFTTTNGNGGVGYFNKEVIRPAGGYFNKDVSRPYNRRNQNYNDDFHGKSGGGKKKSSNGNNSSNNNNNNDKAADKRFKTLPASEALPRNEAVGGYIFVCNNDTMPENLQRQLFGLPPRYRDSVRAITPGLPLFLYNYSTHQLHGIFQAASFGGTNIDPSAWEEKKCPGESRFPAQVRAATRKNCEPLEEDSFRPILHHYDGPKFRLELSVPEALALLDKFEEKSA